MEVLMYWDAVAAKLLELARVAGIVAVVWLAVSIPAALLAGRWLGAVAVDYPAVDVDEDVEEARL